MSEWTDHEAARAEASVDLPDEWPGDAGLVRAQAASIAHYKKMYDRSSALAKIGVWECDLATEELTWTDGVYDLFELPRGSHVDRALTLTLYEDESRREMEQLRADAVAKGGSFTLDIRIRTAKGNERWIRLTADVERENGRSVRIFGTKQDISEEKAAQEKLQALQTELIHVSRRSAMGAMAATLAHELNQPLTAISNYVAGTRRALGNPEQAADLLDGSLAAIESCAFRASHIIRSLRAMTDGRTARRQAVDPNPLIMEAGCLAVGEARDDINLSYELAEGVVVLVDPIQIQQVLINLVRNAVDALEGAPRREIVVSSTLTENSVEIRVDDTGHGIAEDMLEILFDSFISSKPDGMGVGLSISRTIIETHGGKILAANREGEGASMRVVLPLAGTE